MIYTLPDGAWFIGVYDYNSACMHAKQEGHLLLVAGPGGAGKAAFVQLLRRGLLPKDFSELLPENCADWPQASIRAVAGRGRHDGVPLQLIAGYDIMRPLTLGLRDYASDPLLAAIMSRRTAATVVTLSAPANDLIDHYMTRAAELESEHAGSFRQLRHKAKVSLYRLTGSRWVLLGRKRAKLVTLYAQQGTLEHWLFRWSEYLSRLYQENALKAKQPMRLISAARCNPAHGAMSFRLLSVAD